MHNSYRNLLARGQIQGYQQARRMATMQWDNQLAYVAAFNVKQCLMKHDQCRNTPRHSSSGQNIGMFSYTGTKNSISKASIIRKLINMWWREHNDANMNVINSYPSNWSGKPIGHFTVMARESNNRIGCAGSTYSKNGKHYVLFTCNYATTNILNKPVYVAGSSTSGCRTGKNPNRPGLCSVQETYA